MIKYKLKATEEFIEEVKTLRYDWMFDITFYNEGLITCPSIPEFFTEDREVSFTIERHPLIGTMFILWKQLKGK